MRYEMNYCPNCNGTPSIHKRRKKYYIECSGDCWTQTNKYDSIEEAVQEWNSLEATANSSDEVE